MRAITPRAVLRAFTNRQMGYWPVPADDDFARLTSVADDVTSPALVDFYAEWLPAASGVSDATVRVQDSDGSHANGLSVGLNVADTYEAPTARERLAQVHSTMWHEAGHVRHPIPAGWLGRLGEPERAVGAGRLEDAFQLLEDLRVERELVRWKPQAGPWLRYQIGCRNGLVSFAMRLGSDPECG